MSRRLLVVVVALAVPLAGCAGALGGGDGGDARTVNPALGETPTASPTPTPEPSYPPGVGPEEVDATLLVAAHNAELWRANSTVSFRRTIVAANGTTLATRRSVTDSVDDRMRYRVVTAGSVPGEPPSALRSFAFWRNESRTAVRTVTRDGVVSVRATDRLPRTAQSPDDSGEGLLAAAFAGTAPRLVGTSVEGGDRLFRLRAVHDRLDGTARGSVRNLTLTARVTESGVVREYTLEYTATYRTGNRTVTAVTTERFRVSRDGAAAAPPDWAVDALANASDGRAPTAD